MNKFFKVSFPQFSESFADTISPDNLKQAYSEIKLPRQATLGSAGHDFYSPIGFELEPGETIKIPSGICVHLNTGRFLAIFPRSSLGFKYRLQLDNTVGIVDEDYIGAVNEGHIFIKMTNDGKDGQVIRVKAGDAIAQGIILTYEIAEDAGADIDSIRRGGLGSTTDTDGRMERRLTI